MCGHRRLTKIEWKIQPHDGTHHVHFGPTGAGMTEAFRPLVDTATTALDERPTWSPVEGVTFGMWRASVTVDGDDVTLDVWRPEDEDGYRWDVTTDTYGEIADGLASDMLGAQLAAEAAVRTQYPRNS